MDSTNTTGYSIDIRYDREIYKELISETFSSPLDETSSTSSSSPISLASGFTTVSDEAIGGNSRSI